MLDGYDTNFQDIGIWQPILNFLAVLSILTNVLQLTLVTEAVPKWLYRRDHNGSLSGYAASQYNKIDVAILGKSFRSLVSISLEGSLWI